MPAMTDPIAALDSLQQTIDNRLVVFRAAKCIFRQTCIAVSAAG